MGRRKSLDVYLQRIIEKLGQVGKTGFGAVLLIGCVLYSLPGFGQTNLGAITGSVTDQTGATIVSATVTVTNTDTGVSRTLVTNSAGQYAAPSLNPGTYSVRAIADGFAASLHSNVIVGVGSEVRVDLTLMPGSQTQTVTVTAAAPIVDTTNATESSALTGVTLSQVPLNGRQVYKLLGMVPGSASRTGKLFSFNGVGYGGDNYVFDGVEELNIYATGPVAGGTSGFDEATILPADAIQEMQLMTNANAQYGGKMGGVVNVGIKSGTNDIHGTAFAMGRDTALTAKPRFTSQKPTNLFEQFGATVGGPIKKDKLFYFAAYEGQRYNIATPSSFQAPAALAGAGPSASIPDAIAGLRANGITPAALSLNLAGCPVTAPYTPCTSGIFNNPTASSTQLKGLANPGGSDNGLAKIDYHPNERNSINGEYYQGLGNSLQVGTAVEPYWATQRFTRAQLGRAVWVYSPNSNWVNEMRFGLNRENQIGGVAECSNNLGQPDYATAFNYIIQPVQKPLCGFPSLTISGFTALGGSSSPSDDVMTSFAGVDVVSYIHGSHSFKFGTEIDNSISNGGTRLTNIDGTLTFGTIAAFSGATALEDFLAGQVAQSQIAVGPEQFTNSTDNQYAIFLQDDWRAMRRLTLNLGLRWEILPAPIFANNQVGSFSPTQGLEQVGKQISSLYPTDYKDFAPRLGLAWDVTGDGTTVVRAGGGILYEFNPINSYISSAQAAAVNLIPAGYTLYAPNGSVLPSPGTLQTANLVGVGNSLVNWTPGVPVFVTTGASCGNGLGINLPTAPTGTSNPANSSPCNAYPVSQNFKPAYVGTWTAGVEHEITNNVALNVAYVGTRGLRQPVNLDINQPALGVANTKTFLAEQLQRPYYSRYPYLGEIMTFSSVGQSYYNGLQTQLNIRAAHGLTALINYTYSHTLALGNNEQNNSAYGTYVMDSAEPNLDYGPSTTDFRNILNLSLTYDIPGIKSKAKLLEGWQISSVISVLSADAWGPVDSTDDFSGTGEGHDRWSILGNPGNIVSGAAPIPCFGVPSSSFAKSGVCTTVDAGPSSNSTEFMPPTCVLAASQEAVNPNVPGSSGLASLASYGCYYMNGTALVPPAQGTYGNTSSNPFRTGLPFREWDLSVAKSFKLTERLSALFRASALNLTNNTIYALPNTNPAAPSTFGASTNLANGGAGSSGDPIVGAGGPRQINLEMHLTF